MFRISTRCRYGLRTLVELASQENNGPVSLAELASGQDISKKYLESIFRNFQKAGIVRAVRGSHGGYRMANASRDITILDVLNAAEGPINLVDCTEDRSACSRSSECTARKLWADFEKTATAFFKKTTLNDLVEG